MVMRVRRCCSVRMTGEGKAADWRGGVMKRGERAGMRSRQVVYRWPGQRQRTVSMLLVILGGWTAVVSAAPPRCEVLPLAGSRTSLRVLGQEVACWNHGSDAPRPFLFPVNGPTGVSLVRMGHPGAPDHDHHRGVWFAHHNVEGHGFWADGTGCRIVQRQWLAYQDGPEAIAAVLLDWIAADGMLLLEQQVVLVVSGDDSGNRIELQTELRPAAGRDETVLGQTNFGILAVRVAKSISAHFGSGRLTDSEGRVGEPAIFGKRARWMDYSGTVVAGSRSQRHDVEEGITLFDHPRNPDHPTHWHVRNDGWMGASLCMKKDRSVRADAPLTLRYLLDCHRGPYDRERAAAAFSRFAESPSFLVSKSKRSQVRWSVAREPAAK